MADSAARHTLVREEGPNEPEGDDRHGDRELPDVVSISGSG
jgi:hypothetical protein